MNKKIISAILFLVLGIGVVNAESGIDRNSDDINLINYEEKTYVVTTLEDIGGNVFTINEFEVEDEDLENIDEIIAEEEQKYPASNPNSRAFQESYSTSSKTISMDYYQLKSDATNVYHVYVYVTWQTTPAKKDYDVIAIRWTNGATLTDATGVQNSDSGKTSYSYKGDNMNIGSNGVGISMNLHNSTSNHKLELKVTFTASSVGEVYASYQHATNIATTLALSKAYTFSASGLGGVIKFNSDTVAGYYDGMKGIHVSETLGRLNDE